MPSLVKTSVSFSGSEEQIQALHDLVETEDSKFDFKPVVSIAECLLLESGSTEKIAVACAEARYRGETDCPEMKMDWARANSFTRWADFGEHYLFNKYMFGATTWASWRLENMLMQWGALDVEWRSPTEVTFVTTEIFPAAMFHYLAKKFPGLEMDISFFGDNISSGHVVYKNGRLASSVIVNVNGQTQKSGNEGEVDTE